MTCSPRSGLVLPARPEPQRAVGPVVEHERAAAGGERDPRGRSECAGGRGGQRRAGADDAEGPVVTALARDPVRSEADGKREAEDVMRGDTLRV